MFCEKEEMELYGYYRPDVLSYHRYLNQLHSKRRNNSAYSNSLKNCDKNQDSLLVPFEAHPYYHDHQDTTNAWQANRWISDRLDLIVNTDLGDTKDCYLSQTKTDEQSAICIQLGASITATTDDDHAPLPEDLVDLNIEGNLTCDVELVCLFELFISGDTNFDENFLKQICH